MFKIKVDTWVKIAGCPDSGLPALDFRRDNGLQERMDDRFPIVADITDETLFRRLVEAGYYVTTYSDGTAAVLAIDNGRGFPVRDAYSKTQYQYHGASYGWRAEVTPTLLRRLDPTALGDVLVAIAYDAPSAQDARRTSVARAVELRTIIAAAQQELAALATNR